MKPEQLVFTHVNYSDVSAVNRHLPSIRSGLRKPPNAVSASFIVEERRIVVGLSFTGSRDRFSRKLGRTISTQRLQDYLAGTMNEDDKHRFIRIININEEDLDHQVSIMLNLVGVRATSKPGTEIANAYRSVLLTDMSLADITDEVRDLITQEFGPTQKEIIKEGRRICGII